VPTLEKLANQVVRELPPALQTDRWVLPNSCFCAWFGCLGGSDWSNHVGLPLDYNSGDFNSTRLRSSMCPSRAVGTFRRPNGDQHNLNTPTNLLLGLKRKLDAPRSQRSLNSRHAIVVLVTIS
jgi:hypothetical protein